MTQRAKTTPASTPGSFAPHTRSESEVALTAPSEIAKAFADEPDTYEVTDTHYRVHGGQWRELEPAVPLEWAPVSLRDDSESVRVFYPAYMKRRAELRATGRFPYNSEFEDIVPSQDGGTTAAYYLQQLHSRDETEAKVHAFAGEPVTELPERREVRRDVAHHGFYVGGFGFKEYRNARVVRLAGGRGIQVTEFGKRNPSTILPEHSVLMREVQR